MRKFACGKHIKHHSICELICEVTARCVYNGLSNIGILCNQILWESICIFDWNRLSVAELDRHYVQNGRDSIIQNMNV